MDCSNICGETASWIFLPSGELWFRSVLGNPTNKFEPVNIKNSINGSFFFQKNTGKSRVGLATRDEPVITPWQTRDYPVTTRDIVGKTRYFGTKPGYVQPVITPWQTHDYPVTTRDFFTGSNVPPMGWKIVGKWTFFMNKHEKNWDPMTTNSSDLHLRFKFEFKCYSGISTKALFGAYLAIDCFTCREMSGKNPITICKTAFRSCETNSSSMQTSRD